MSDNSEISRLRLENERLQNQYEQFIGKPTAYYSERAVVLETLLRESQEWIGDRPVGHIEINQVVELKKRIDKALAK